jgi:hypothetical protein|tara:strand:- start:426 stop:722 length:297 start_codon:yes stop_codon:yes gene_type:complete
MERRGFYNSIIVNSETKVILDGHHKWNAASKLKLTKIPAILVDYYEDDSITVDVWPTCDKEKITKKEIIEMGLSDSLFPPTTGRHRFEFKIPNIGLIR